MAFAKRRKNRIIMLVSLVLMIILFGLLIVGGFSIYNSQINKIKVNYETQIEELKLQNYYDKRVVLAPLHDIMAGELITEDKFMEMQITSSLSPESYMTKEDIGKYAIIDIAANTPIMKVMLTEEIIKDDLREQEFNMILLPSNIKKDQYIDLRIGFSNGEDYIVLSKKKVRDIDLNTNTIWLWMDEQDILTASSAIVDAYLHKATKLYTVIYVEPSIQKPALPTYPVNQSVLAIMQENPNIVAEAQEALSLDTRQYLEERLAQLSAEDIANVDQGIKEEYTNRDEKIMDDQNQSENELININTDATDGIIENTIEGEDNEDANFFN